jgi:hypothetical protein
MEISVSREPHYGENTDFDMSAAQGKTAENSWLRNPVLPTLRYPVEFVRHHSLMFREIHDMSPSSEVEGSRHQSGVKKGAQLWNTIRELFARARGSQEGKGNERLPAQGT